MKEISDLRVKKCNENKKIDIEIEKLKKEFSSTLNISNLSDYAEKILHLNTNRGKMNRKYDKKIERIKKINNIL